MHGLRRRRRQVPLRKELQGVFRQAVHGGTSRRVFTVTRHLSHPHTVTLTANSAKGHRQQIDPWGPRRVRARLQSAVRARSTVCHRPNPTGTAKILTAAVSVLEAMTGGIKLQGSPVMTSSLQSDANENVRNTRPMILSPIPSAQPEAICVRGSSWYSASS